jgi:hypothetical protein
MWIIDPKQMYDMGHTVRGEYTLEKGEKKKYNMKQQQQKEVICMPCICE